MSTRRRLHPATEPIAHGMLPVGDGHALYWETVGSGPTPAVYLHGGPGSGCGTGPRRLFDPGGYRAALLDQRGAGHSLPRAEETGTDLTTNTTAHLVADLEALRRHLGVERQVVVGVSWGVTPALAYAQAVPDRVRAMVLGAVTAGTRVEVDWTRPAGCRARRRARRARAPRRARPLDDEARGARRLRRGSLSQEDRPGRQGPTSTARGQRVRSATSAAQMGVWLGRGRG